MKKRFQAEDIGHLRYLSWPVISEDSKKAAWVSRRGNGQDGLFRPEIHVLDLAQGNQKCLSDKGAEKQPYFLKDSDYMMYLSDRTGEFQVWLRNLKSGRAWQLTTLRHGIVRYAVNEQETKLAFEAVLWPEEIEKGIAFQEMSAEEKRTWEEEMEYRPYYATDLTYKRDEWRGMRKGEYAHIGTVTFDTAALESAQEENMCGSRNRKQELLPDKRKMECVFPSWSHDGMRLAFYGYPHHGARGLEAELFVCGCDGKQMQQMTDGIGLYPDHAPVFTADDSAVVCMGFPPYEDGSCVCLPYRIELEEQGKEPAPENKRAAMSKIKLLPVGMQADESETGICHGVAPAIACRTEMGEHASYFWLSEDEKWIYFLSGKNGRTGIYRAALDAPWETEQVLCEETSGMDVLAFCMNAAGRTVWLGADAYHPAELYYQGRQLSLENGWLADYELGETEEFWTKSRDGKADLQWFLVHPAGKRADGRQPAVFYLKGGPTTMHTGSFWHEFQALAGAGFAVLCANPRGSVGFGRKFCADEVCWKEEAMYDLLDILADADARGYLDMQRVGVTGGSYGGYMTNKLLGRTDIFAAAAAQRCLVNPAISYGTGDTGFVSAGEVAGGFKMLDYLSGRAKGNIISYIDQFHAPLLILHGMKDYRCGFEQAEQLFTAMKERHPEIPVRLVAFPQENHEVSREGKLYNQIRHLSELVDWFKKYLQKDGGENA